MATDAPAFATALAALAARNARNPALGALYQEATRRLAATHRKEALRYHLRYLHQLPARFGEAKPLPKQLFAQPEQAERFQALVNELAFHKKLNKTLAKVPAVYVSPRKKIELDNSTIHAVRDQHVGTVALLNTYLQDAPAPTPLPAAKPARDASRSQPARPAKAPQLAAPAASAFAAGLALAAPQRALLQLFGERALTLPQAEVEAFASAHGTLRNQLIDGLNGACYALLDDVLVEESGADYSIYEVYYQQLAATPC